MDRPYNVLRATALLRNCAKQFRFYERNHRAKASAMIEGPGVLDQLRRLTLEKAETNAALASEIEAFLDS